MKGRLKKVQQGYYKGLCSICGKFPEYRAIWKLEGINLIEHYCDSHKSQIPR
jgi:hypothetical protein